MRTQKVPGPGDEESPNLGLPKRMVKPAILLLLKERRAHGYALVEELENLGLELRDAGGVYRVLRDLEESRLVRSEWEPRETGPARRVYELTSKGERELVAVGDALHRQHDLMANYLRRYRSQVSERNQGRKKKARG